jgi:NAD(P)-dependent dehydrogenase (short-subunit alcohol dehydrogenase family)
MRDRVATGARTASLLYGPRVRDAMRDPWFAERSAVVTGGGSGIGRAIALALAGAGSAVVVADIAGPAADDAAGEAERAGGRAIAVATDVSREDAVRKMVASAVDRFGRLDLLVNCAGNLPAGKPVVDLAEAEWRSILDVHLTGTFLCCREAMPRIADAGGAIVNMSSSYAFKGRANGADYSAAKAGIFGLTRVVASELAPRATANALAPGPVDTPRWRAGLSPDELAAKRARRVKDVPLGRLGAPEDIADAALFLLGPHARWITGQVIHVNGGEFYP